VSIARSALVAALGLFVPAAAGAACLAVADRDGRALATIAAADDFVVRYMHSVTRTPVEERYRLDGGAIVQTELRFSEHGPGLPTQSDAGHAFLRTAAGFVVTMERRFDAIAMRVHADQSPELSTGMQRLDLTAWGNRALVVSAAGCASR
jgi:hypothetical protein